MVLQTGAHHRGAVNSVYCHGAARLDRTYSQASLNMTYLHTLLQNEEQHCNGGINEASVVGGGLKPSVMMVAKPKQRYVVLKTLTRYFRTALAFQGYHNWLCGITCTRDVNIAASHIIFDFGV